MIKEVFCTFQLDGTHNWTTIPDTPELSDVQFLKSTHRHLFNFKCYAYVTHNDRDIEFINMKRHVLDYFLENYYNPNSRSCEFGSMSCEMLAEEVLNQFSTLYKVEVNEDNENGSIVTRKLV